jgi:hypothetical protein
MEIEFLRVSIAQLSLVLVKKVKIDVATKKLLRKLLFRGKQQKKLMVSIPELNEPNESTD